MFTRTTCFLFATLLAAPGCALEVKGFEPMDDQGEDGGEDDSGPVSASGEDTGADPTDTRPPPDMLMACDLEFACEFPVELVRDGGDAYAAADECALQTLAGGLPRLVQTVAVFPDQEAFFDLVAVAPGVVLRQAHGRADNVGYWHRPVERCTLAGDTFFKACLSSFDAGCLDPDEWATDCKALGSLTCPRP